MLCLFTLFHIIFAYYKSKAAEIFFKIFFIDQQCNYKITKSYGTITLGTEYNN